MALVLLGRGLRNRKTITQAICPTPIRMDGTPERGGPEKEESSRFSSGLAPKIAAGPLKGWPSVGIWRR